MQDYNKVSTDGGYDSRLGHTVTAFGQLS